MTSVLVGTLGLASTLIMSAVAYAQAPKPERKPAQEVATRTGDSGNFVIETLDERKARKVFTRVGVNAIVREGNKNFVTLNYAKGDAENAPRVAGPVLTTEHSCKRTRAETIPDAKFECEAFRLIIPPGAGGVAEVPGAEHGGAFERFWGHATIIVAGGRFYNNGRVSQVITGLNINVTDEENVTFGFILKPAKEGVTPLPRFDGQKFTGSIVRLVDNVGVGKAVVTWDVPALAAAEAFAGKFSELLGRKLGTNDQIFIRFGPGHLLLRRLRPRRNC